jgi:D-serine deaminase-like pyridoxal phosphate-dependent protein
LFTEIQAGSYALMDMFHAALLPGEFERALSVLGTVVSEQGGTVVLDVGSKSIDGTAAVPQIKGIDFASIRFDEEHCIVEFAGPPPLRLGDRAELVPGYGPSTVNLYDAYCVVEGDTIADIWSVCPRGPGRPGAGVVRSLGRPDAGGM